ncbi:antitoxin VbhA family protein [Bifidobacterium pullorum subsp. saeculare]|uniref:Antitoxin VbhA family protein n=1 Tax=Bifidobacterium pullorum subsp. saeculare TaxID=78257 RepID=A0A938WX34_9BIFI|nr:antitoxin VbhA family protein [Bifidobacterium pullorum]MBM6699208.1 antitoxin VbhA family protein [Bifidobacterium pullorum subsp. saeculare]
MVTKAELQRESYVRAALHSNAMEGSIPSSEWVADAHEYIQGKIDTKEMRRRALARCGIMAAE